MSSRKRELQQTYARVAAAISIASSLSIGFAESNKYPGEWMKLITFALFGLVIIVFSLFSIWATKKIRAGTVGEYRGRIGKLLEKIQSIDPELELAFFRSLGIPLGVGFMVAAVSSRWSPSDTLYAVYGIVWIFAMAVLICEFLKMRKLHRNIRESGDVHVTGDARESGDVHVTGDARESGDVHVTGDVRVTGKIPEGDELV
ncbi:hypothetical protein [Candidatus Poriferisocius sp.]|uniref:hypothetical protein n=1 Tax=Candidatus Poriferisocius sp. TaxID=3101276 RepID=UPI003B0114CB